MTNKIVYKSLNLNLPEEWHQKLNILATEKNKTISELMIQLIGNYLGDDTQEKPDLQSTNLENLVNEYQKISDRLKILENRDHQLEKLEARLVMMEKLMDAIQRQITVRDHGGKLPSHSIADSGDFEDEPDEILTDFLY